MPFTFSHPAIILPLKKVFGNWVSLTGLVIGSITPDFEYFVRMRIESVYSHTLLGALWFNLPLAILLCFLFHSIIKNSLIENSPKFVQLRVTKLKNLNWKKYFFENWIVVCISIIVGIYSHIFWDSFTHQHGFFTNFFSLDGKVLNTEISIFKILQHSSTLIGGILILWYFFKLKKEDIVCTKINIKFWIAIAFLTISILVLRVYLGLKITEYGNIIVSAISAGIIAVIMVSLFMKNKTISNLR